MHSENHLRSSLSPSRPLLLLWTLALLLCSKVQSASVTEDYAARTYTGSNGQTIPYRLLQPAQYDPKQKYPLVLFLHGAGERGNDNQKQLVHGASLFIRPENKNQFPCFVIAPQCPENKRWVEMNWSDNSGAGARPRQPSDPMQLVLGAIESLKKEFSIDTNRIYVTGLSMGGFGTWDCITRFPDRFAAGAPICGGGDETTLTPSVAKVPVWAFHSEDDNVVKVGRTRDMVKAWQAAGGKPKYFEYFSLGHNSWDKTYSESEFLPWMFAQRLGKADSYRLKTKPPELPAVAYWPAKEEIFPGKGPLQKADWFQNLWRQKRASFWNNRERERGAIVFLGDSITQGWNSLAKDFPNLKVANRGISGDTTRGVRLRLKEDVTDLHPQAVVLLIGTNDLGLGGDPETTADNAKAIVKALKNSNPSMPIILCQVMPSHASKQRPADKITRLNALLNEIAKGDEQVIGCDTWSIFANAEGDCKKEEFPDLLHPNQAGYAKWTKALKPILATLNLQTK